MMRVKGLNMEVRADLADLPPLLLLHGLLSSRNHWLLNQSALRKKYRLIIAELPGHGRAPACTDPNILNPNALADELDKARQMLGIKRWHICGQSFGSGITLRHALRYPHAVASQVWTNGNRVLAETQGDSTSEATQQRCQKLEAEGVAALRRETFHPRHGRRFPNEIRERLSADADSCDIATIAALMRHTLTALPMRDLFSQTKAPTLLVNGRLESRFQPVRHMAHGLLPTMEIADLEGGHAINIEQADLFNDTVIEFLGRHDHLLA